MSVTLLVDSIINMHCELWGVHVYLYECDVYEKITHVLSKAGVLHEYKPEKVRKRELRKSCLFSGKMNSSTLSRERRALCSNMPMLFLLPY